MKTKILIISALGCMLVLSGINPSQAQVKFGPVAGVNFSDMTGDYNSDGMLIGYHLGLLVNFGITDYFMVEPQLLYSTKGAKGKKTDLNLSYIEIPIWIRYQLENGLNFNVGPYFGILTSAKQGDTKVKDNYESLDYGFAAALGYQLSGGLGFSAGYFAGLADVGNDISTIAGPIDFNTKINVIKLTVSYTVGGKRD